MQPTYITTSLSHEHHPHCALSRDTFGEWFNTADVPFDEIKKHFVHGEPGEATVFHKVFLPHNCSYHRFTQNTLQRCVAGINSDRKQHIIFLGDSTTRGLVNGITRIASGSELYGPCQSSICGILEPRREVLPPSYESLYNINNAAFWNNTLQISFAYIMTFLRDCPCSIMNARQGSIYLGDFIRDLIKGNPGASLVLNTGAWDYDHFARNNKDTFFHRGARQMKQNVFLSKEVLRRLTRHSGK